ncbi:MAG TPA: cupin domain-containing protein [Paracoccaceae bacterium]|nr:cupin domain-containing protein [Paracoccaceae bacterium]
MTDHPLVLRVVRDGISPEVERPQPARVTKGDPVHSHWPIEDRDGLSCGLWQSTPGAWQVDYAEWEYVHILSGLSVLTGEDGSRVTLGAGDSWIIRPGFRGVWEVVETTLKEYVIRG